ncbi:MAG: hypothetical protein JST54_28760 [Deltaproteobacteria bacterium]|nr:hypothetical protein [Deltaproteobacteria bacterium]
MTRAILIVLAALACGCPEHTASKLELSTKSEQPVAQNVVATRGCASVHLRRPATHVRVRA